MAGTLDLEPYLRDWLEKRAPALAGRVFPGSAPPGTAGPFLAYARVSDGRLQTLGGPTGVSRPRVQLDVWSKLRDEARGLADRVAGTRDDPGLDGLTGLIGPDPAARAFVQSARQAGGHEAFDRPAHDDDADWYVCSRDYVIWFEETLRSS